MNQDKHNPDEGRPVSQPSFRAPLAAYAATEATSRGRRHAEAAHPYRGLYQRDRDRVLHSSAFRRLLYKTQVFVNHEGDLYRTRLTHSLEVAQIARTVAGCLGLNSDLVEAICLAHDLGHTPFGHAGQEALNRCMRPWGGFEHNLQSLRVVDELEERYADFPGLNLCFETREGILKHCAVARARELGELGERFLKRHQPGLEAQLANLADEVAYNNHDVDDGLRAGLLTPEELLESSLFRRHWEAALRRQLPRQYLVHETIRQMINEVVSDLVATSRHNITTAAPGSIEAVRACRKPLIAFSPGIATAHRELKQFLRSRLYSHERVLAMNHQAGLVIEALFLRFMTDVHAMPQEHARRGLEWEKRHGEAGRARAVADYTAGMTDRYAVATYRRLVDPKLNW